GDWARGIALLERGLASLDLDGPDLDGPICYELYYHLAIGQCHQGDNEAAALSYQMALAVDIPEILKLGAYNNLASLLQDEGLLALAGELYEQAIALDPSFATAHYNLGKLKRQQGDLAGAIAAYKTALKFSPDKPEIHQNLGVALLKAGAIAASQVAFAQALELYEAQGSAQAQLLRRQLSDLHLL
ncbi:MAG: tetratricopeptide repeat protein, partial [Synechococcales cyanobacterium RM1_1_8]|nr:tetratricopeptide repeat protein [Synechococcales cyanobacterium RM1_1_8]